MEQAREMNTIDILDRLPFELAARLESDPFFFDIPVVVAEKGNLAREYQKRQAVVTDKTGKRGVCVVVLQIVADDNYPGIPGGPMMLKPAFQVVENPELNNDESGTKKSVRKVSRQIVKNMKLAGFRGIVQNLKCGKPAIEPVDIKELGESCVAEQVNFEAEEFSDEPVLFCLPPVCTQVPGQPQIILTTATPGAAIWFTTDDSYPYPGDANQFPQSRSTLYAGPIAIDPNNFIIRAGTSLAGYIDSSIERFHN
jgi:hypothetical protein